MNMLRLILLFMLFSVPVHAAGVKTWRVDAGQSRIGFVIKQMNVPVEGGFARFAGQAAFDPARPENGRFSVTVDTASIDSGSPEGDDEVRRPAWFDVKRYPAAGFTARQVRRTAEGRYLALGDLNIKGRVLPVEIPFSLTRQGAGWLAQGRAGIRRSSFGIGAGDWNDVVADDAEIRFNLVLLP